MFIHDNGKVHVMSNTRCGHTSMRNYFNMERLGDRRHHNHRWLEWIESKSRRVLVLRNPIDRWQSAEIFHSVEWWVKNGPSPTHEGKIMDRDFWMWIHRSPFLIDIPRSLDIEIIPFENLSDYIPMHKDTIVSNTSDVSLSDLTDIVIPPGTGRTQNCLEEELISYQYFRNNCKVIGPEEWKELTP